jgi:hypothetical protein
MPRLRNGHAPGHVRETFCNAIEAFMAWNDSGPAPTVEYGDCYGKQHENRTSIAGVVGLCGLRAILRSRLCGRLLRAWPLLRSAPAVLQAPDLLPPHQIL